MSPLNKWTYITIIVALGVALLGFYGWSQYHAGGASARAKSNDAAIKVTRTLKAKDAKIKKGIPHGDDAAVDGFLLSHTR